MAVRRGLAAVLTVLAVFTVFTGSTVLGLGAPPAAHATAGVPAFPGNTRSHYLTTLRTRVVAGAAARDAEDARRVGIRAAAVVLDAGSPAGPDGSVVLPDSGQRASTAAVQYAVTAYAKAWLAAKGPALLLIVGTTTYGAAVSAEHGAAWARLVAAVRRAVPGVDVRGGLDAEMAWGPPRDALAWVHGYLTGADVGYVDFGDCPCPPRAQPPHGWTLESRWAVATGGGRAVVLPQIYATAGGNAQEWAALVAWSRRHHPTRPVRLIGVLSELAACTGPPRRACAGIDAAPAVAWSQLASALGSAAPLRYATDIGYLPSPGAVSGPLAPVGGSAGLAGILTVLAALIAVAAVLLAGRRPERRRRRAARRGTRPRR